MNDGVNRRALIGIAAGGAVASVTPVRRARAADPIRLGLVIPLSGPQQINGQPIRIGAEVARDQSNRAGGVGGRMIDLVIRDDKGDPTQSVAAVRELTSSGVNLILGVPLTATAMAVSGIMPSLNGVYIATGTNEDKLTHELYNRNFFTAAANSYTRSRAIGRFLAQRYPAITSWVGIYPDVTVGHDSFREFSAAANEFYRSEAKVDITILPSVVTKYGTTDFKQQIAGLMGSPAQGLYSVLFGADGVTFFQQARQFGLDKKLDLIVDQALDLALGKALGVNFPRDVWSLSNWYHGLYADTPASQELLQTFKTQTGDDNPGGIGALGHVAVSAYAAAIKAADGTETDKVIAALEGLTFQTLKGPATFRKEDHQIIDDLNLIHMSAKAEAPGWGVTEAVKVPLRDVINPPTPGKPLRT